jgi:hypothetical protein
MYSSQIKSKTIHVIVIHIDFTFEVKSRKTNITTMLFDAISNCF